MHLLYLKQHVEFSDLIEGIESSQGVRQFGWYSSSLGAKCVCSRAVAHNAISIRHLALMSRYSPKMRCSSRLR
jgi:hypothetical protein